MGEAVPEVEALLLARMSALGMDGEAYANYAAGMLADDGVPADEARSTLLEMLVLTVDDGRDLTAEIGALLDDARALQDEAAATAAAAAAAEEAAAAAALAALTLPRDGSVATDSLAQLPSKDAGVTLDDMELDAGMRRALAARYGYIEESDDSETEAANAAAAAKAAAKAAKRAKEPAVVRSSALDAALSDLAAAAASGPDIRGLGRRAKRTALAAAEAPPAATATASSSSPAAASASALMFGASPVAASSGVRAGVAAARDSDISDIVGGGGGGGDDSEDDGKRGRRGGRGGRRRGRSSSGEGGGGGGGGGGMVEFDPLSIQLNNKAVAKEAERAKREEAKAKHEEEERALREAAEAARAARAKAMQSRLGGTPAGGAAAGRGRGRPAK